MKEMGLPFTENQQKQLQILAEKDSIVFYLGMKEIVPENLGKTKIDQIIKEEMAHIKLLSKELVASQSVL